jgi:hypothetical protein
MLVSDKLQEEESDGGRSRHQNWPELKRQIGLTGFNKREVVVPNKNDGEVQERRECNAIFIEFAASD